jgi:hypothetical protein
LLQKVLYIITIALTAGAVLQGFAVSVVSWIQRKESAVAKILFSLLISVMSLTLLYSLVEKLGLFHKHPFLLFFPIYFSYAFGPLLFFYVKASLYQDFKLGWSDLKHFLLPIAQANFFFFMIFQSAEFKYERWVNDYSLLYGTFGYPVYLLLFTVYSYFAYRFIKFRIKALAHIEHSDYEEKHALRLKKMVKGLYLLLIINSSFIISNFLSGYLLHITLTNNSLYLFFSESSFAAMIIWVGAYGYYRVMRSLIGE